MHSKSGFNTTFRQQANNLGIHFSLNAKVSFMPTIRANAWPQDLRHGQGAIATIVSLSLATVMTLSFVTSLRWNAQRADSKRFEHAALKEREEQARIAKTRASLLPEPEFLRAPNARIQDEANATSDSPNL